MYYPLSRNPAVIAFIGAILTGTAKSHMIMANPKPYGDPDNSPLTSSNYPCKVTSDPATFYSTEGRDNTMVAGESQTLSLSGSAVHGGGSCQLAITDDLQPSASTSWRVILSIESGCPSKDGTSASTYNYTIPEDVAEGKYSFAWTWISKLAGQPEYYMNCAPITVKAGTSSKAKRDTSLALRAESYPELFVANLEDINDCKTTPGTDPVYPAPGSNVEKLLTPAAKASFATITATGCVPKGQSQTLGSLPSAMAGGSGGSAAAASASTSAAASSAATPASSESSQAASSSAASAATAVTGTPSPTTLLTVSASVYVSPVTTSTAAISSSATAAASSATAQSSPATTESSATTAESSTKTTATGSGATATGSGSGSSGSPTGSGSTGSGSGSSNSTSSSGSSGYSGACTNEGIFNCVGEKYQQCASGSWSTMQALPAGTSCKQGQSSTLWARGDSRKSRARDGRMATNLN